MTDLFAAAGVDTPRKAKAATLRKRLEVLRPMMVEAANASDAAQIAQAPYASAFYEAHRKLQYLHKCRTDGGVIPKDVMLGSYDRRMVAGVDWNPFKQAAREAERWRSNSEGNI